VEQLLRDTKRKINVTYMTLIHCLFCFRTCVFCGLEKEEFLEEARLEEHYCRSCPMLHSCPHCVQVEGIDYSFFLYAAGFLIELLALVIPALIKYSFDVAIFKRPNLSLIHLV